MHTVALEDIFSPSEKVVARNIAGEIILVPITSGVGNLEDDLYSLNATAKEIWEKLDGRKNVRKMVDELVCDFQGNREEIQEDVIGLLAELYARKIIIRREND